MLITISPYPDFLIPDRFTAGSQLSPNEAAALNNLLARAVRNHAQDLVSRIERPGFSLLTIEEQETIHQQLVEYAATYEFPPPPPHRLSLIEEELSLLLEDGHPFPEREARKRVAAKLAAVDPNAVGF